MEVNTVNAIQSAPASKATTKAKDNDGDSDGGAPKVSATPAASVEISQAAQQAYHASATSNAKHKKGAHTHLLTASPATTATSTAKL